MQGETSVTTKVARTALARVRVSKHFLPAILFATCFGVYVGNGDFLPGNDQVGNMLFSVNLLKRHSFAISPPDAPQAFFWTIAEPGQEPVPTAIDEWTDSTDAAYRERRLTVPSYFYYVSPIVFPEAYVNTFGIGAPLAGLPVYAVLDLFVDIEHDRFWWWHGLPPRQLRLRARQEKAADGHLPEPPRANPERAQVPATFNVGRGARCRLDMGRMGRITLRINGVGLTFDPGERTISGTPPRAGHGVFMYGAYDSQAVNPNSNAALQRLGRVLEGRAAQVAAGMRRSATKRLTAGQREPVDKCANYLLKHQSYLAYDQYLGAGLPIGSGVVVMRTEGGLRWNIAA